MCSAHCICFYAYELYQLNWIRSTIISVTNNISGRFWKLFTALYSLLFHIIVENVKYYFAGRIFSEILSLRWKWRQKWCSLQIQVWKFPLMQPFFNDSHPSQPFRCRYATILPVAWLHWNGCQGDYFNDWLWKIKIKWNRTFVRQCHFISANNGLQK